MIFRSFELFQFNLILNLFVCLSVISNQNCFFPVAVSEENISTKSEKQQQPIPPSLIQMNDRDKIELEFDRALRSVGLDFGFLDLRAENSNDGHLQSVGNIKKSKSSN